MPKPPLDLNPVSRITVGAIGEPGRRTFYLQARKGDLLVTLLCEKEQVSALCLGLRSMLEELRVQRPRGEGAPLVKDDLELEHPVSPLFRAGNMGLGYDEKNDLIVIVVRELLIESGDEENAQEVRFFCSRAQADALSRHGLEVVAKGRPICPLCGKPMDREGNVEGFCPRRNGHADELSVVFA